MPSPICDGRRLAGQSVAARADRNGRMIVAYSVLHALKIHYLLNCARASEICARIAEPMVEFISPIGELFVLRRFSQIQIVNGSNICHQGTRQSASQHSWHTDFQPLASGSHSLIACAIPSMPTRQLTISLGPTPGLLSGDALESGFGIVVCPVWLSSGVRRTGDYFTRLSVADFAYEPTFVPDKIFRTVNALTLIFAILVCKIFGPVQRRTLRCIEPGFCFRFCHNVQVR